MSDALQGTDTPPSGGGWYAELPEDIMVPVKGEDGQDTEVPMRQAKVYQKYSSSTEALKALAHAQHKVGRQTTGLVAPDENATQEVKDKYAADLRKAWGVPDDVSGYGLQAPEGYDPEAFSAALSGFLDAGYSKAQVEALMVQGQAERAAQAEAAKKQVETYIAASKKEEGEAYDANSNLVDRLIATASADGKFGERIGDAKHDPVIRKALLEVARYIPESKFRTTTTDPGKGMSEKELHALTQDARYADPDKRDPEFVKYVEEKFKEFYGE